MMFNPAAQQTTAAPSGAPPPAAAALDTSMDSTSAAVSATSEPKGYMAQAYMMLTSNPYFSAGAGLYGLGMAAMVGRYGSMVIGTALKRRYVVSLECTSRDQSFDWLMQWMSRHPTFGFQQMSIISKNVTIAANDQQEAECTFAPSPNVPHWLLHKGWPIMVYRKRQVERAMGNDVLEVLELTSFGRGTKLMRDIVEEAQHEASVRDSDKTVIYHNAGGRWIRQQAARTRRALSSVVLDGGHKEEIVSDVRTFLDSKDYYQSLGVPYRRGYLLYGPPGCGKSSLVTAIAGELRLAICVLSLSNRSLDDEGLNQLLNSTAPRVIILMEDIDRAFTADSRVTMSGLLNALDGVAAQEGRLVFMTTNHVERLDAALIRPGRADVKMEVGLLSTQQIMDLFKKFFPDASVDLLDRAAAALPAGALSAAQLQSHLFLHRDDPEAAVRAAASFVRSVTAFDEAIARQRAAEKRVASMRPPPMI